MSRYQDLWKKYHEDTVGFYRTEEVLQDISESLAIICGYLSDISETDKKRWLSQSGSARAADQ